MLIILVSFTILGIVYSSSSAAYSQNIKTAGNTLLGIVNDILDFSKIEEGKMNIVPVEYDF